MYFVFARDYPFIYPQRLPEAGTGGHRLLFRSTYRELMLRGAEALRIASVHGNDLLNERGVPYHAYLGFLRRGYYRINRGCRADIVAWLKIGCSQCQTIQSVNFSPRILPAKASTHDGIGPTSFQSIIGCL